MPSTISYIHTFGRRRRVDVSDGEAAGVGVQLGQRRRVGLVLATGTAAAAA